MNCNQKHFDKYLGLYTIQGIFKISAIFTEKKFKGIYHMVVHVLNSFYRLIHNFLYLQYCLPLCRTRQFQLKLATETNIPYHQRKNLRLKSNEPGWYIRAKLNFGLLVHRRSSPPFFVSLPWQSTTSKRQFERKVPHPRTGHSDPAQDLNQQANHKATTTPLIIIHIVSAKYHILCKKRMAG